MQFRTTVLARVVGRLSLHALTLSLDPGGRTVDVPVDLVPEDLRRPNSEFHVVMEAGKGVVGVVRVEEEEAEE